MKRKVNRVGQNTLTVSLPSKWAAKFNLKKGDELEILEKGKLLIINHENEALLGEKEVDLRQVNVFSRRMIVMPYIHGYDSIRVYFKEKEMLYKIRSNIGLLMGFELVEEGQNYCVLKNIAKGIESEFQTMSNRLLFVVSQMGTELFEALKEGDINELKRVEEYEDAANKLNLFCRRMLNIKGSQDRRETTTAYSISCLLEAVTDAYRDIIEYVCQEKIKPGKKLLSFFEIMLEQYKFFLETYNKFEPKQIPHMREIENKILKTYQNLNLSSGEMVIAGFLIRAHFSIRHATEELD